jgi:hypothetical protein
MASRSADWLGVARLTLRQDDLAEERAPLEREVPPPLRRLDHDVGADDVGGHQVRGELDAGETQIQALRQGLDQEGLSQPRHPLQEGMPTGEQTDQDAADDLPVAHHHLGDLPREGVEHLAKPVGSFFSAHTLLIW